MEVGDEVICINAVFSNPRIAQDFQELPVKDGKYIIRELRPANVSGGVTAILLEEIRNAPIYFQWLFGKAEPAFAASRFRKMDIVDDLVVEEVNVEKM